jgi:hypothetical protein
MLSRLLSRCNVGQIETAELPDGLIKFEMPIKLDLCDISEDKRSF